MAKKRRLVVEIVKETLRLKLLLKKTNREIGRILGISKSTVATYVSRAKGSSLTSYEQVTNIQKLKKVLATAKPKEHGTLFSHLSSLFQCHFWGNS